MNRIPGIVCIAIAFLYICGALGLIDFQVCIKPAGQCVPQPKD